MSSFFRRQKKRLTVGTILVLAATACDSTPPTSPTSSVASTVESTATTHNAQTPNPPERDQFRAITDTTIRNRIPIPIDADDPRVGQALASEKVATLVGDLPHTHFVLESPIGTHVIFRFAEAQPLRYGYDGVDCLMGGEYVSGIVALLIDGAVGAYSPEFDAAASCFGRYSDGTES